MSATADQIAYDKILIVHNTLKETCPEKLKRRLRGVSDLKNGTRQKNDLGLKANFKLSIWHQTLTKIRENLTETKLTMKTNAYAFLDCLYGYY